MGEAIITRAGGGEADTVIPITPGYHTILAVIKDPEGGVMANHPVSCKDGSRQYNYTTNAKGQVMFVCNSGAANIFVNNYNGAYRYIDVAAQWKNIDAPVGLTSKVEINLEHPDNSLVEFLSSVGFELYSQRVCDIDIVGGGGGGSAGADDYSTVYRVCGGGGGAGYLNNYINQNLKGQYNFIVGSGGSAGNLRKRGGTGGTSYIMNTNYSAIGGAGGNNNFEIVNVAGDDIQFCGGGIGGLGNGGGGINIVDEKFDSYKMPEKSSVTFAGGGGGAGTGVINISKGWNTSRFIGMNYGGNGAISWNHTNKHSNIASKSGSRGGGGGGGCVDSWSTLPPSSGGAGLLRINIKYD